METNLKGGTMDKQNLRIRMATQLLIKYLLENRDLFQQTKQEEILASGIQANTQPLTKSELNNNDKLETDNTSPTHS